MGKTKSYTLAFQWAMIQKALNSQKYKKYFKYTEQNTPDLIVAWYLSWQYAVNVLNDSSTKDLAMFSYDGFEGYSNKVAMNNFSHVEALFELYFNWDNRMGENLILEILITLFKFYEVPMKEKLNDKWEEFNKNNTGDEDN